MIMVEIKYEKNSERFVVGNPQNPWESWAARGNLKQLEGMCARGRAWDNHWTVWWWMWRGQGWGGERGRELKEEGSDRAVGSEMGSHKREVREEGRSEKSQGGEQRENGTGRGGRVGGS